MKNETRIERLNATLYLAVNVPAERLDQESWSTNCDTTHCISGWCADSPWHRKRGFGWMLGRPLFIGSGSMGGSAFADFHGITYEEANAIVYENTNLKGEAARADVVSKLKALIIQYGGEIGDGT